MKEEKPEFEKFVEQYNFSQDLSQVIPIFSPDKSVEEARVATSVHAEVKRLEKLYEHRINDPTKRNEEQGRMIAAYNRERQSKNSTREQQQTIAPL